MMAGLAGGQEGGYDSVSPYDNRSFCLASFPCEGDLPWQFIRSRVGKSVAHQGKVSSDQNSQSSVNQYG